MLLENLIFPFDYVLLVISIILIVFSFWKGFVQSLLGLLTWIGSIILTIYSYNNLSKFISEQLLKINILKNYESITILLGTVISIPLIFLLTLFILKKIRRFLSQDLDKQILGVILDKFFGFIFGIIFSYLLFSSAIYFVEKITIFNTFYNWILQNSYILEIINNINMHILNYYTT